jgi:hypothetical protein
MTRLLVAVATGWTRRRAANVGTLILAVSNAAISYDALSAAARAAGLPWFLSWLFPLATDGIIAVATPAQLELRERNAPWWVQAQITALLWAAIVFSVIGNASRAARLWSSTIAVASVHVPVPTWSAVWLALPPLAYAGALHVLGLVHRYPAPPVLAPAPSASAASKAPRKARSKPAREQATRLSAADVRTLVASARDAVLANTDRPADQSFDEAIAQHMTASGHRIAASRVRSYLAELRRESAAGRPRVVVNQNGASA